MQDKMEDGAALDIFDRNPHDVVTSVRIDRDVLEALKDFCKERNLRQNYIISEAVRHYMIASRNAYAHLHTQIAENMLALAEKSKPRKGNRRGRK